LRKWPSTSSKAAWSGKSGTWTIGFLRQLSGVQRSAMSTSALFGSKRVAQPAYTRADAGWAKASAGAHASAGWTCCILNESTAMGREEIITRIRKHADAIRAEGATALYLFGSAARDEAGAESDIDVFVEFPPEGRFSLLNMSGIRLIIMDEIGREVDITTRNSLHPRLKDRILAEAVRVL
jgi:predicted nucleotidyltransferase